MKTPIPHLLTAVLFAASATACAAESSARYINHGRAGYIATHMPDKTMMNSARQGAHRETTVALVMEKPAKPHMKHQTMGRAGYKYIYKKTPQN